VGTQLLSPRWDPKAPHKPGVEAEQRLSRWHPQTPLPGAVAWAGQPPWQHLLTQIGCPDLQSTARKISGFFTSSLSVSKPKCEGL